MGRKQSNGYDALAIHAATRAALDPPTPEAAAEDRDACQLRDVLWEEYERRLRDEKTYTTDALWDWLKEYGADCGRNTPWRDRRRLLATERQIRMTAAKARAVVEAAGESGADDTLRGGRRLASQLLFTALMNLPEGALEGMDTGQVLRMIETLSKLSKAHAETDLIGQRLTEMRDRYDTEIAAAQDRAKAGGDGDGRIRPEDILAVRKAVFGEVA